MGLRIDIQDDDQLREEIKKLVEGQVKAIVREEVREWLTVLVKDTITKSFDEEKMDKRMREAMRDFLSVRYQRSSLFKEALAEEIEKEYKDYISHEMAKINFESIAMKLVKDKLGIRF